MIISIDKECKLILYADDSTILFSHKDPVFISQKLGHVLECCSEWLVDNKLSLHLGKTEYIMFGPIRKVSKLNVSPVNCNDHTIKNVKKVKYLGLQIVDTLSGDNIVNNIVSKVNAKLKFLYRHKTCLDFNSRKLLSSALLQCHFDYCCSSWFHSLNKAQTKKLQIMQNKIIRFIRDYEPRTSITNDDFVQLKMLNVENRVKQLKLSHMHKIYYGKCPSYLSKNFEKSSRSGKSNFIIPIVKNAYLKKNVQILWVYRLVFPSRGHQKSGKY